MEVTVGLPELISSMGDVFGFFIARFANVLTLFTSEPLLLLLLGIMIVGAVIGLTMRVVHRS